MLSSFQITDAHPLRWLTVGQLLDARNRRVLRNAHLVYNRERILHAGEELPKADILQGKTAPDAALPDFTALPGLIEGHSHLFLEGAELDFDKRTEWLKKDAESLYQSAQNRARQLAQLGIVAMRDGGDTHRIGLRLSHLTTSDAPPAWMAAVASPGPAIFRKGRYGSFFGGPLEEHRDIAACVAARVADGADHIKIVPTGIINFAKGAVTAAPQFSAEEIRQFSEAAHAAGRQIMAHASGAAGIGNAIEGGVDTLEHGFFITDEQLQKMRDQGAAWVPTLLPVQKQVDHADIMGWQGQTLDNLRRILENHAVSIRKALELGVNVLVGSDAGSCGVPHGIGLIQEMELLEAAGMSPMEVLCQATAGNSQIFATSRAATSRAGTSRAGTSRAGTHPRIGTLEPGTQPRFILTQHNPLETVANLHKERLVIFDGQVSNTETVSVEGL